MARKIGIFLLITLGTIECIYAQSFYAIRKNRSLIASVGTGTSTYFGELKNDGDYLDARPNLNVGLQYFFTNRISVRSELNWFQLSGNDAEANDSPNGRLGRNLSFRSNDFEFSATGLINLIPMGHKFYQRPTVNLYAFAGIGVLYSNPKAKLDGNWYALQPLRTEDVKYSRIQPVIPYGLGVRLKVGPFINVAVEGAYRLVFTDYLDDVSTVHPNKTGWDPLRVSLSDRRPELGLQPYAPGTKRGNPDKNDGYFLANIKVEYYLPYNFSIFSDSRRLYNKKRKAIYRRRRR